jgi:hypothetical protein
MSDLIDDIIPKLNFHELWYHIYDTYSSNKQKNILSKMWLKKSITKHRFISGKELNDIIYKYTIDEFGENDFHEKNANWYSYSEFSNSCFPIIEILMDIRLIIYHLNDQFEIKEAE